VLVCHSQRRPVDSGPATVFVDCEPHGRRGKLSLSILSTAGTIRSGTFDMDERTATLQLTVDKTTVLSVRCELDIFGLGSQQWSIRGQSGDVALVLQRKNPFSSPSEPASAVRIPPVGTPLCAAENEPCTVC
jgi:hypothetical protein